MLLGLDNPDNSCSVILSDDELLAYLDSIEKKTLDYLDTLTDQMLYEKPEGCKYTRMELILRQYRHLSFHTGMLNGQTAIATGKFPMWVSETNQYLNDGILFGRYRKYKVYCLISIYQSIRTVLIFTPRFYTGSIAFYTSTFHFYYP